MPSLQQDRSFIRSVAAAAVAFHKSNKFSAAVNIAQGCLESLYGTACPSANGVNSHNLYGIKADSGWHGPSVLVPTEEYEDGRYVAIHAPFRAYPSFAASVADHNKFFVVNPRYHNLFGMDYVRCAETIAAVDGYATDPHYGEQLLEIIRQFGLAEYDRLPPMHWAVTVGYFDGEVQAREGADRILKDCDYASLGVQHVGKSPEGNERWTVQVGYFASPVRAQAAEMAIERVTQYHCITVQVIA